ncbi:MAG TPA: hypothetical protein PLI95_01150 [Polyangiaceae bacterium]|nr:hypothetical protein [Polyangiaceae bacterium]
MRTNDVQHWLSQDERRLATLRTLTQPLTASHLAQRTQRPRSACSALLRQLASRRLVRCLNNSARRSRVYGLTLKGHACLGAMGSQNAEPRRTPEVDWAIYGWICFSQRSAVLKALTEPLQPATIKRRALRHDPTLTMSANNVRDVIRLFLAKGLVSRVHRRAALHPQYALTALGRSLHELLMTADTTRIADNETRTHAR